MPTPSTPRAELEAYRQAYERAVSDGHVPKGRPVGVGRRSAVAVAGERLGLGPDSAKRRYAACFAPRGNDLAPRAPKATPEERQEILRLRGEVSRLRREQKDSDGEALLARAIQEARAGILSAPVAVPDWVVKAPRLGDAPGVPTLLATDWHAGEVVRPEEVYHRNAYNKTIADDRVRKIVDRALRLAALNEPSGGHRGGVVFLGGDFVSGALHEELFKSDDMTPLEASAWCVSRIVWMLRTLRDSWGRLHVVGVPGNHGRLSKRPPAKGHAFQAYDWLIYTLVAQHLDNPQDRRTITLDIPEDGEAIVNVAGTRYLLQHGHQLGVSGGDGIIGAIGPIMRGNTKLGRAQRSLGRDFDVLVLGHFHQNLWLPSIIVGGTSKGFDEYSRVSRFPFEPASQLMWFTHPKYGPTAPSKIFLQEPRETSKPEAVAFARTAA